MSNKNKFIEIIIWLLLFTFLIINYINRYSGVEELLHS